MSDNSGYEYMHEESIGERSKCTICTKPLVDPVSTKCKTKPHIFCRHCIEKRIEYNPSCYMCNEELHTQDLKSVTDNNLIDALDRILIKCVRCGKTGLKRGHFHDHKTKICPKVDVFCRSSDLKCPWIGPRDQLDKHLKSCIFNLLRPLITELQNNNQRLTSRINQQETQIGELENENQQLASQVNQQKTQIGELQNENQRLRSQVNKQETQIGELQNENQQVRDQTNQVEKRLQLVELMCVKLLSCSTADNRTSRWKNALWRIKSCIPRRNGTKK